MPLIIVTGLPCSGKTHRTQQIAVALSQRITQDPSNPKRTIQIINSHHASSDSNPSPTTLRDQIYNSAAQEKTARAEEFSAIKRAVSKDNVVIADGLNYIKGYRYQLWCEAKAAGTRCCVVHVAAQEDECKAWNRERLRAWGREADLDDEESALKEREATKHGKDALGDLTPESHTAIYGDRVVGKVSRSRSSSVDAVDDGEGISNISRADDTMTLKSLYISDKNDTSLSTSHPRSQSLNNHSTDTDIEATTLPSIAIPPPSSAHPYRPSTLTSLIMRYEPPSPFSRWDTPLFTVPCTDTHPPYADIWGAIFPAPKKVMSKKALSQMSRRNVSGSDDKSQGDNNDNPPTATAGPGLVKVEAVRQHAATLLPLTTSSSALQILESTTLEIVKTILAAAREQGVGVDDGDGGAVTISIPLYTPIPSASSAKSSKDEQEQESEKEALETEITIPPGTILSQPLLQRLRRKYTQIQRAAIAHGREYAGRREGRAGIVRGFVGFIEGELGE